MISRLWHQRIFLKGSGIARVGAVIGTAALLCWPIIGCQRSPQSTGNTARQASRRQADRGEALLAAAISQLRDLPSYIETDLRPPVVILDSTKSRDHQDVLATVTRNPQQPDGPINYLTVITDNGRFRALGVKPGDRLKYYVLFDKESLEADIQQRVAMELTVAQVIDDRTLLIENGLTAEVPRDQAAKIEIWRYVDDRLTEISRQLARYVKRRLPPLGWEPTPDEQSVSQIVVRLNQWLRQSQPQSEWQVDPLLSTLDPTLANEDPLKAYISAESLAGQFFQPYDGRLLQQNVWLRDISRWASGQSFERRARAAALFDWTVRNIQLDADSDTVNHHSLWQVLASGHGTAEQRAWVFAELCRQRGLDVVILAIPKSSTDPTAPATDSKPQFWLPALVDGDQLYLFDTRLGLPIPGLDNAPVASLQQVQADEALLRQLDLPDMPYPVKAEQLKNVVAQVVASPFELTRRAKQLGEKLTGEDQFVTSISATELATRVKAIPGIADVQIWDMPFRTLRAELTLGPTARYEDAIAFEPFAWCPTLWKARMRHFQGRKEQQQQPGRAGSDEESVDDHRDAARLYASREVRPTDRKIANQSEEKRRIDAAAKLNASYWIGLLKFDAGDFNTSADWLARPELAAADSPWAGGARYNLARALEALGKLDEAIALLNADKSPQQHGNRLRAQSLKARADSTQKPAE